MKYDIHPDFARLNFTPSLTPLMMRAAAPVMKLMASAVRVPESIRISHHTLPGYRGKPVSVEVFTPTHLASPKPCLLYFHGGAFVFRAAPYHKKLVLRYAEGAGCAVAFPEYHLLPEYPFPAAQTDAVCTFDWLVDHADELGIDRRRIAIGGDSAGGLLTAAVCALGADASIQMLLYPALDARMQTESMKVFTDTPLWNSTLNKKLWAMYLINTPLERWAEASPMQWPLPKRIPPAYIETAEFDCLRDEGIAYAERLRTAGAEVTLNQTQGTIHGYDMVAGSAITEDSVTKRIAALKQAFVVAKASR